MPISISTKQASILLLSSLLATTLAVLGHSGWLEFVLFLQIWLVFVVFDERWRDLLGRFKHHSIPKIFIALLLCYLFMRSLDLIVKILPPEFAPHENELARSAFNSMKSDGLIPIFLLEIVSAAMEEFYMSSLTIALFHFVRVKRANYYVIPLSALIFAVTHGPLVAWTAINFVYLFALRLFINWAWAKSQTLWGAILFHFLWNTMGFIFAFYHIHI